MKVDNGSANMRINREAFSVENNNATLLMVALFIRNPIRISKFI